MSRDESLTEAQEETLAIIKRYLDMYGHAPTMGELQEALHLRSIRSVTQRVEALERKGFISRDRFQRRGIRIVGAINSQYVPSGFIAVPVIASAGCDALDVYAQDEFGEFIAVDKSIVGKATSIAAIKAVGDSMVDAGIHNGDYVIVEVTDKVDNGDRVVAIIGNMAVIKRLEQQSGFALLHPENAAADYRPIVVKQEDSKIFGKVLSVIPNQEWVDDVRIEYYDGFGPRG
jgi:repressor LexA